MRGAVNEKSVSAIPSKIDGAMNNFQKSQGTHKALRGASRERVQGKNLTLKKIIPRSLQ